MSMDLPAITARFSDISKRQPIAARKCSCRWNLISVIGIVAIIAIIVGLNKENLAASSVIIFVAVIVHNISGLAAGYGIAKLFKVKEPQARTIAIEIGMQNSGLAVALAIKYFSALAALGSEPKSLTFIVSSGTVFGEHSSIKPVFFPEFDRFLVRYSAQ